MKDYMERKQIEMTAKYRVLVNYLISIVDSKKDSMYIEREQIELILKSLEEVE